MTQEQEAPLAGIVSSVPAIPAAAQPGVIKALSYLLGGLGSYVGAWLRRPAQAVEDGTSARTIVTNALAQAAAERAATDPRLVEAALAQWAPATITRQVNKAQIARQTLEELETATEGDFDGDAEISEDFLNTFERFCEDASSEKMQGLWARVLAGELRRPGTYSRRTLRSLYDLDARTAELFDAVAADVISEIMFVGPDQKNAQLETTLELEAAGILTGAGGILTYNIHFDDRGLGHLAGKKFVLLLLGAPNSKISLDALPLSAVGRELLTLLPEQDEDQKLRSVADQLQRKGATGAAIGLSTPDKGDTTCQFVVHLWGENPFGAGQEANSDETPLG